MLVYQFKKYIYPGLIGSLLIHTANVPPPNQTDPCADGRGYQTSIPGKPVYQNVYAIIQNGAPPPPLDGPFDDGRGKQVVIPGKPSYLNTTQVTPNVIIADQTAEFLRGNVQAV